jgi:CRP/FNR family cyclic AMP-dependent transcriptional regulator
MDSHKAKVVSGFDAEKYLKSAGPRRRIVSYRKGQVIFSPGAAGTAVHYIQRGRVKISITTARGKEAVIALLGEGEFFGEGCIAGQPLRVSKATAIQATSVLEIRKDEMIRVMRQERKFSNLFFAFMLKRNIHVEEQLIDQLFNSTEKRLAHALLLFARYGKDEALGRVVPKFPQDTLARMIGTTPSRVNFLMSKFRRRGFIHYKGGLHVNNSLLRVILKD